MERRSFHIIQITSEGVNQGVDLKSQFHHFPIFIGKICKEWLLIPDITNVLYKESVNICNIGGTTRDLRRLIFGFIILIIFVFNFCTCCRFLRNFIFRFPRLVPLDILVVSLGLVPRARQRLPFTNLLLKPRPRLQILDLLCQLVFSNPFLQILVAIILLLPRVFDLIKSLTCRWQ